MAGLGICRFASCVLFVCVLEEVVRKEIARWDPTLLGRKRGSERTRNTVADEFLEPQIKLLRTAPTSPSGEALGAEEWLVG